jgi:hypothetical protein
MAIGGKAPDATWEMQNGVRLAQVEIHGIIAREKLATSIVIS